MSERIRQAEVAYAQRDISATKRAHTKAAIEAEVHGKGRGEYLGDFVLGAIDGCVTTFAVVAGVAGASLSAGIVLVMGFANLFADGFSMAVSNFSSLRSSKEFVEKERQREAWEIEHYPDGEMEEIKQIYKKKGFKGKDLERAVSIITSNKEVWIDTMIRDELQLTPDIRSPWWAGFATFMAFIIIGFVPLLAYVLALFFPFFQESTFMISTVLTLITFFSIGAVKYYVTGKNWLLSGLETLFVGSAAAVIAYFVGYILKEIALLY